MQENAKPQSEIKAIPVPKEKIAFILAPSKDIPFDEARKAHINYLENGPYVMDGPQIVHSLFIKHDDLQDLARSGTGGMRLYFCKELASGQINIIAVPIDGATDDIIPAGLINNLEPCPNRCPCSLDYSNSQSTNDLNFVHDPVDDTDKWCKPNLRDLLHASNWFNRLGVNVPKP